MPSTDPPGTDQPSTDQPGTHQPGTHQPTTDHPTSVAPPSGAVPRIEQAVAARVEAAARAAFAGPAAARGEVPPDLDPQLRPATRPEFGHFQTSLPLRLARPLGLTPHEAGGRLLAALDVDDLCEPPTLAGAGFVNLTVRADVLAAAVTAALADPRLGVPVAAAPQRVVVDLSSPNVAKQMHVGHLRSTVIGDAVARVLAFAGHDVVRVNHVGDWGTQFGMLLEAVLGDPAGPDAPSDLDGLDALYRAARARFDADPAFADAARRRVVALQSGDPASVAVWRRLVQVSLEAFDATYARLGAALTRADVAGESTYNEALPGVVADLDAAGLLTASDGALCWADPRTPDLAPLIVRKADGGFGYAATDLAAVRHRVGALGADRLVYVVDARQGLHFSHVFALARAAGWLPAGVEARHLAFGTVLGPDGTPFRTRAGGTVPLTHLLDAAQASAAALLDDKGSRLAGAERAAVARAVGVGAVKYADLSSGLGKDYTFSLDRLVATDGDTGPYLQYAHARTASVLDRSGADPGALAAHGVTLLAEPAEVRLALLLTRFPAAVEAVVQTLEPHRLCGYLYEVATALSVFWERCPVLRSEDDVRTSRLALCLATRRVLATGLDLLGIEAPDRM